MCQGLLLSPLLFVICINNLDSSVVFMASKLADDTKVGVGGMVDIQQDLNPLRKGNQGMAAGIQRGQV